MNAQRTHFSLAIEYTEGSIGMNVRTMRADEVLAELLRRGFDVDFEHCKDSCRFEGWMTVHVNSDRTARKLDREFADREFVASAHTAIAA